MCFVIYKFGIVDRRGLVMSLMRFLAPLATGEKHRRKAGGGGRIQKKIFFRYVTINYQII